MRFLIVKSAALASILYAFTSASAAPKGQDTTQTFNSPRCRCLPHQPCWPSVHTWSSFNQTVGGRLIATYPAARECHSPFHDKNKCDKIKEGYFWDHWRQLQPGAVQQTNWEALNGRGCLGFNETLPCDQGNVPLFTVNASTVTDVQETARFASKHNLRLVIKNTGHDYLGRSTAANSLSLWMYFRRKVVTTGTFVPEGAPAMTKGEHAVIIESGALWKDVYLAVHQAGRVAVGGADATVGAGGGYCSGGGHGILSPMHGLCVDNVLQFKIVTADGELRVANAYQNQDLFWALRGGGVGTFGVLVETVLRTHPALKNILYVPALIVSTDPAQLDKVARDFWARQAELSQSGFTGYCFVDKGYINLQYYVPNTSIEQGQAAIQPFLDYARSLSNVTVLSDTVVSHLDFYSLFKTSMPGSDGTIPNAGKNQIIASRLIPTQLLRSKNDTEVLSSILSQVSSQVKSSLPPVLANSPGPHGGYLIHLVAGGQVSAKDDVKETSVLPAWRRALVHVVVTASWLDDTPLDQQRRIQSTLTKAMDRVRAVTPNSGAYTSEADPNEPKWQRSFWGDNYPRLRAIKMKYDPKGLFICRLCVGSDSWSEDLNCRRTP